MCAGNNTTNKIIKIKIPSGGIIKCDTESDQFKLKIKILIKTHHHLNNIYKIFCSHI